MKSPLEVYRFRVQAVCTACGEPIDGTLSLDARYAVCDSGGFVLLQDGPQCDPCVAKWSPLLASTEPVSWPADKERLAEAIVEAFGEKE